MDGDDNEQRYQYANGLIGMDNGDNLYTYLKNAHGDIVQMTDNTGAVAEDYTYDAWGNQESATHTVANPFRYSGEYFDEETGLIYLRNRYYDSGIGRFITEDPVKDGLNWYVYCENNPVMFVDPSGYLREPGYNAQGVWSQNPDLDDYGADSKTYTSLLILTEAYEAFPEYSSVIAELANEVRWIGNEWGVERIEKTISIGLFFGIMDGLSTVEQVFAAAYPSEALAVNSARKKADRMTYENYGQEGNGTDVANAFKHIYWSAYATAQIGETYAKLFTTAHEFGWYLENLNNPEAMKMDLHNNQRGRIIGKSNSKKNIEKAVLKDIKQGNAAVLRNGKSVTYQY